MVFATCRDFLRTVPVLQHDPNRPEDVDTEAEDHAGDEASLRLHEPALRAAGEGDGEGGGAGRRADDLGRGDPAK